jgi:hypothetical protein
MDPVVQQEIIIKDSNAHKCKIEEVETKKARGRPKKQQPIVEKPKKAKLTKEERRVKKNEYMNEYYAKNRIKLLEYHNNKLKEKSPDGEIKRGRPRIVVAKISE